MSKQTNFIKTVSKFAVEDQKRSGVLPSLTIAQSILESSYGTSELATKGNALFGIKATKEWNGKTYTKTTSEYVKDKKIYIKATFRAYDSWEESIKDHNSFLSGKKRYSKVVNEKDYKKACIAILSAGYATDPNYANKLIEIIEKYKLYGYDNISVEKKYYRVQAGAYKEKSSAEEMVSKIKNLTGIDSIIKLIDGLYKVQVGAYSEKKYAEETKEKLKSVGIDCFITYY